MSKIDEVGQAILDLTYSVSKVEPVAQKLKVMEPGTPESFALIESVGPVALMEYIENTLKRTTLVDQYVALRDASGNPLSPDYSTPGESVYFVKAAEVPKLAQLLFDEVHDLIVAEEGPNADPAPNASEVVPGLTMALENVLGRL